MNTAETATGSRQWSLAARLTVLSTLCAFALLLAAALFLHWELSNNLQRDAEDRLRHKVQVLARLIAERPPNVQGIRQEAHEEAEVSSDSDFPFYLRVLDADGREVVASHDMATLLPLAEFTGAVGTGPRQWRSEAGRRYLLSRTAGVAGDDGGHWTIDTAFDVSAMEHLLGRFRRDLVLMLLVGLLGAASLGTWAVRRGLRPLQHIAAAMEPIGAAELDRRISAGRWPAELRGVAVAFDQVLDRLQGSFDRLRQFSADLAHELRTPINNLMGEAQVALSRPRSAPDYERVLQSSLEELSRLARMIDGMLFLAQADQSRLAVQAVPLQADAQLRAVAEFYHALSEEQGVAVRVQGNAALLADPMLVRRALSNLLSNALRHTPRGGTVELLARQAAGGIELEVRDNGTGIAAQHHARLGDRFFRVDPARSGQVSGYGLGLAIVRSIMALHAGDMRIDSAPGRGTSVTLEFPSAPAVLRTALP